MSSITVNQPVIISNVESSDMFLTGSVALSVKNTNITTQVTALASSQNTVAITDHEGTSVFVYTYSAGSWSLEQTITGFSGSTPTTGTPLTIDGDVIAFCTFPDPTGDVHVYTRSGTTWSFGSTLSKTGTPTGFGLSVSMDNGTLIVGAPNTASGAGGVYVYTGSGATWTEQLAISSPGDAEDNFGSTVSLNGNTMAVRSYTSTGKIHVYTGSGASWSVEQVITSPSSTTFFGLYSALSLGNDVMLVGAYGSYGRAYSYTRSSSVWTLAQTIEGDKAGGGNDRFGASCSIYGSTAVIGEENGGANNYGKIYIYRLFNSQWERIEDIDNIENLTNDFGKIVSMGPLAITVGWAFSAMFSVPGSYNSTEYPTSVPSLNVGRGAIIDRGGDFHTNGAISCQDVGCKDVSCQDVGCGGTLTVAYLRGSGTDNSVNVSNHLISNTNLNNNGYYNEIQEIASQDGECMDMDGNTMVIGNPYTAGGGEIYIYTFNRDTSTWSLSQTLSGDDTAAGDEFGFSVSIKNRIIVVGAHKATVDGDSGRGAVYVFGLSGQTWSQDQKFVSDDGASNDRFGSSVATNGSIIVVGAKLANVTNIDQGAAYIFNFSSGWTQYQKLSIAGGAANDEFGFRASIHNTTILISTYKPNSSKGAAYVFDTAQPPAAPSWSLTATLTADDGAGAAGDRFGWSIAQSETTIVVGAYLELSGQGAAYVFQLDGSWFQTQKLTASDKSVGDNFGIDVAINYSGFNILVGAPYENSQQGSVYLFNLDDGTWTQTQKIVASNGSGNNRFGNYIALSGTQFSTIAATKPSTYVFDIGYAFLGRLTSGNMYGNALTLSSYIACDGGASISGILNADATTGSSSTTTGSIVCDGGIGIAENAYVGGSVSASGALSASSLDVSGTKNFKIPHPHPSKTETHNLVHSAVEAPAADLLYRGTVTMPSSTTITVDMDSHAGMTAGTFELLTKNVQVFTTNESSWTLVRGSLSGATLTIETQTECSDTISWMVIGTRQDACVMSSNCTDTHGDLVVEPEIVVAST